MLLSVDNPVTVMFVEVSSVTERETRFTDLPCRVIERFLSSSFKNTGVVAVLTCKSNNLILLSHLILSLNPPFLPLNLAET